VLRSVLQWLSPAGAGARLSVLIFHRVLARPDPLFAHQPDARRFDEICGWLGGWFNVLALDDAVRRLRSASLPERALAITFDDGYADNHDHALPILQRHRFPATFFIATGFVGGGTMWNDIVIEALRRTSLSSLVFAASDGAQRTLRLDAVESRRAAIATLLGELKYLPAAEREAKARAIAAQAKVDPPADLMMSREQIRRLRRAGMQIGAHTVSHPILARLERGLAERELVQSKTFLEDLLDEPVVLFAYPNGKPGQDYGADDVALVARAGFECAVSTAPGAATRHSDCLQLPRFTPWDRGKGRFGVRMARNLWAPRPRPAAAIAG
jgi:peptidoglycan/xylan/chitin deacetylase (PgdA/CDA1 family)